MQSDLASCICEYHDPSGVFPLLQQQLQSKLPLRNLHWKPNNRPLRSIDSLHVDLVPSPENPSSRPQSSHSAAEQPPNAAGPVKERRHQIPGLRRTPYLKLYILRSDDVETYRESSRKALKEWLKTHTPPSQKTGSSAQEKHDAFEWMILHVVMPNTAAGSQPRYSKTASKDEDAPVEKSGGSSRLKLGRSSNTLLEKLKADFNVSSKSAPDRIAQIRLFPDDIPAAQLPPKPPVDNTYVETPQDRANAWSDVITKFRTLILASFDLRVRQYEDDVRERGSQRALPGWNFCTFFVLKEGLARGFESVGLLDDALLGYDELSIELDSILREQGATAGFLAYTDELQKGLQVISKGDSITIWNAQNLPISATRRPYREMILSNQTSVFDFKCYIFARQMQILLRMAMVYSNTQSNSKPGVEDVGMIAELVRRTTSFLSSVALVLHQDLSEAAREKTSKVSSDIVDSIVASWTYAVCQQLIEETNSSTLATRLASVDTGFQSFTSAAKPKPIGHPPRGSSLSVTGNAEQFYEQIPEDAKVIFDRLRSHGVKEPLTPSDHGPLEELAGRRAELHLMQRSIVERLADRNGWPLGWKGLQQRARNEEDMEAIELDDQPAKGADGLTSSSKHALNLNAICSNILSDALTSVEKCQDLYKDLTQNAICHFLGARTPKAVERLMADLAVLRYELGDFTGAANIFGRITPLYAERDWGMIEAQLLKLHAECLKKLNRRDDYIRMLLVLVSKVVSHRKIARKSRVGSQPIMNTPSTFLLDGEGFDSTDLLKEVFEHSKELPYEVTVPMDNYFDEILVEPYIRHIDDNDGFQVRVKFRHLLDEQVEFQTVKLHLQSLDDGPSQEIWLQNDSPVVVKNGLATVALSSKVNSLAEFQVEKLILVSHKIAFTQEDLRKPTNLSSRAAQKDQSDQKPIILCYPRADAFNAQVTMSRSIEFGKVRQLILECTSGKSSIEHALIKLRPATGGLRLRTINSTLLRGEAEFKVDTEVNHLEVLGMNAQSSFALTFPYELPIESDLKDISLRLEVNYRTPQGSFDYITTPSIHIALPLDVNVHDLFKATALYSRFNVRTATNLPLEVLDIQLAGSQNFKINSPSCKVMPVTAFANQAIPMLFKVQRIGSSDGQLSPRQSTSNEQPLVLKVTYRCYDEIVAEFVKSRFARDISSSPVAQLAKLLEVDLLSRLGEHLEPQQYAEIALLREIALPNYEIMGWDALLTLLPPQIYDELKGWLQVWHKDNSVLYLDEDILDKAKDNLVHDLAITVPVPRLHILNTATLSFPSLTSVFVNGQSINATLTISHTRSWESPDAFGVLPQPNEPIDFVLDLDAPTDTWLIGGMRRARFFLKEGDTIDLPVVLLPLREGRLPLPTIEIRIASRELEELSCVTENRSMGDSVLVVGDVQTVSISLKEGMSGTEVVLDEMGSRQEVTA